MQENNAPKKGGISVETEHIFPIIKKWLYSEKEIFLRELVSNACDAVTKLRRLSSLGEYEGEGNVGITLLKGKGGYTGDGREILLCAFHKQLYPRVRKMVKETDPKAFMIVTRANEVFGEGFKNPFADEM